MAWHYLTPNHGKQLPRRLVFVDTETTPVQQIGNGQIQTHKFRLGVAIRCRYEQSKSTRRQVYHFDNQPDFWEWFFTGLDPRATTWLFAHNLPFDMTALNFSELSTQAIIVPDKPRAAKAPPKNGQAGPPQQGYIVLGNPPTILSLKHVTTGNRFIMLDTLNFFPVPLRELGEQCGLDKLPMPPYDCSDPWWAHYCQNDCAILERTVIELLRFCEAERLGNFKWTAAMLAMQAFRHRFMPTETYSRQVNRRDGSVEFHKAKRGRILFHDNADVKRLERKSYHGGRVESFYHGTYAGEVFKVDVNGLYPSVMARENFPIKLLRHEQRPQTIELRPDIDWARSIATVRINSPSQVYPIKTERALLFVRGDFETTLAGPELYQAIQRGHVTAVGSWAEYETFPIFETFARELWRLRLRLRFKGHRMHETFAKLLLNSLHGKFGQWGGEWQERPEITPIEDFTTWVEYDAVNCRRREFRSICWQTWEKMPKQETERSFPAISAFVTAYGRRRLNQLIETAGIKSVLYVGTDALLVTEAGYWNLEHAGEIAALCLGRLKVEQSGSAAELRGTNDYRVGDRRTRAGQKKSAVERGPDTWDQYQFSGVAKWFDSAHGPRNTTQLATITRHPTISKGKAGVDAWIVPFVLPSDQDKIATPSGGAGSVVSIT